MEDKSWKAPVREILIIAVGGLLTIGLAALGAVVFKGARSMTAADWIVYVLLPAAVITLFLSAYRWARREIAKTSDTLRRQMEFNELVISTIEELQVRVRNVEQPTSNTPHPIESAAIRAVLKRRQLEDQTGI